MNQFPDMPETLSTRQVECIACRELFSVSEDQYLYTKGRTREWRLAVNSYPETHLRYQPDRSRRPITPEMRSEPVFDYDPLPSPPGEYVYINCPRCGADNRNWIKIRYIEKFHHFSAYQFNWAVGLGLALLLSAVALTVSQAYGDVSPRYRLAFAVVVFTAGIVPLALIPRDWRSWRDFNYAFPVLKNATFWEKVAPPYRRSIVLFLVLVLGLPLFFFVFLPWLFNGITTNLTTEPSRSLMETVDLLGQELDEADLENADDVAVVQTAMNELYLLGQINSETCRSARLIPIVKEIEALPLNGVSNSAVQALNRSKNDLNQLIQANKPFCDDNWVQVALSDLRDAVQVFPLCEASQCRLKAAQISDIYTQLDKLDPLQSETAAAVNLNDMDEVEAVLTTIIALLGQGPTAEVESRINRQVQAIQDWLKPEATNWFTVGITFLTDWGWFTGVATILALGIAIGTTDHYIRKVDTQLPRPLYYSVSNMMRVAIWESNRALEIGGTVHRIQWTMIGRNELGGIDMVGLFRDPPELVNGRLQTKVRAQEYRIRTDRWCKIESATIVDKMVDLPANSPLFVQHTEEMNIDVHSFTGRGPLR